MTQVTPSFVKICKKIFTKWSVLVLIVLIVLVLLVLIVVPSEHLLNLLGKFPHARMVADGTQP